MAPYPTPQEITTLFAHLTSNNPSAFFTHVSADVDWELLGTHPLAGHYKSLSDWKAGALEPINAVLREPLKLQVRNVVGGGDQEWACVELFADAVCKDGMEYPQRYSWVMRFDDRGMIVQVRAYLDSALVQKALDRNKGEIKS